MKLDLEDKIILDEIQQKAETLSALLKEKEYGFTTWHMAVRYQMEQLHRIIGDVLGK